MHAHILPDRSERSEHQGSLLRATLKPQEYTWTIHPRTWNCFNSSYLVSQVTCFGLIVDHSNPISASLFARSTVIAVDPSPPDVTILYCLRCAETETQKIQTQLWWIASPGTEQICKLGMHRKVPHVPHDPREGSSLYLQYTYRTSEARTQCIGEIS